MSNIFGVSSAFGMGKNLFNVAENSGSFFNNKANSDNKENSALTFRSDVVDISEEGYAASQNAQDNKIDPSGENVKTSATTQVINAQTTEDFKFSSKWTSTMDYAEYGNHVSRHSFDNGATVSIYEHKDKDKDGNAIYFATIEKADDTFETVAIGKNTVFSDDGSGNIVMSQYDKDSPIKGSGGDDFIFSLSSNTEIYAGEGNDNIIVRGNNTQIYLGDGNNTIKNGWNPEAGYEPTVNIEGGNGNNEIQDLVVSGILGDGNNKVTAGTIKNLTLGDGMNRVAVNEILRATFGDGENTVTASSIGTATFGDGDNRVHGAHLNNLIFGDGNNTAVAKNTGFVNEEYQEYHIGSIVAGNGDNNIQADNIEKRIQVGNGDNKVRAGDLGSRSPEISGTAIFGDGNNDILFEHVVGDNARLYMGDGDNKMQIKEGHFQVANFVIGDGNNIFDFENVTGALSFGNGNNLVNLETANNLQLQFQDGNNTINAKKTNEEFSVYAGTGKTALNISSSADGLDVQTKGNTNLSVKGNLTNSSVMLWGEQGNNNLSVGGSLHETNVELKGDNGRLNAQGIFNSTVKTDGKDTLINAQAFFDSTITGSEEHNAQLSGSMFGKGTVNGEELSTFENSENPEKEAQIVASIYSDFVQSYSKESSDYITEQYESTNMFYTLKNWDRILEDIKKG